MRELADMVADMEVNKVADMEVDKVADMEVDKVADMVANMEVDMVANMVVEKLFWPEAYHLACASSKLCEFILYAMGGWCPLLRKN